MTAPSRRWCSRPPTARCSRPRTPAATGSASRGREVRIAVLGGGAWGGVLAAIAARHGHDVVLWEIDRAAADALARDRTSARSVAGFKLPAEVAVSSDVGGAVAGREMLVVAVPSAFVAATLRDATPAFPAGGAPVVRSEERRVGKAGRGRWSRGD